MNGIRHFLRDFTARAVREHLRSELESDHQPPRLTRNEVELVRFVRRRSAEWAALPADDDTPSEPARPDRP